MPKEQNFTAGQILDAMPAVAGEVREVHRCSNCGNLFGRRFIPFGLGEGLTVNPCLCILTSRSMMARAETVLSVQDRVNE